MSAPFFLLLLYDSECIIVVPEFMYSCSIFYSNKLDSNLLQLPLFWRMPLVLKRSYTLRFILHKTRIGIETAYIANRRSKRVENAIIAERIR